MLTAYRVIFDDGSSYCTSMAAGVTLQDARAYFIGQTFEAYPGRRVAIVEPCIRGE